MRGFELFLSGCRCAVCILTGCFLLISCQTLPNANESERPISQSNAVKSQSPGKDEWLTSAQYQQIFNKQAKEGFYPIRVEGRCENGGEQFHAQWQGVPSGASFYSHHAITKESFEVKNQEYISRGYSLVSLTTFKDCSGTERYQATWLKMRSEDRRRWLKTGPSSFSFAEGPCPLKWLAL